MCVCTLHPHLHSGLFLKLPIFDQVPREHLFDDELTWEVPEEDGEEQSLHQIYSAREQHQPNNQGRTKGSDGPEAAMIPLMNRR